MARRAGEFTMTHLFCFGLGYSARIVAERLSARGFATSGTSTTAEGAAALSKSGSAGYVFNGHEPNTQIPTTLARATHLLLSVPPGADGDPVFLHHGADIAASPSVTWIGYFSTVGVYGDAGGGWVDEETEPRPASETWQAQALGGTALAGAWCKDREMRHGFSPARNLRAGTQRPRRS